MNIDIPQPFACPRCGAPGHAKTGGAVYNCHCRFGNYGQIQFEPMPRPSPDTSARPVSALSEEEIRGIVREEIARALDGVVPYNRP